MARSSITLSTIDGSLRARVSALALFSMLVACDAGGEGGEARGGNGGSDREGGVSTGGTSTGGTTSSGGGGAQNTGGSSAGSGGSTAGTGGSAGASSDAAAAAPWRCPAGPFGDPLQGAAAEPVAATLLADGFVTGGGVLEGPVWIDGALYASQFAYGAVPSSRILKLDASGNMSVFAPDAGTNGLAVDAQGDIVAGRHADGSISRIRLSAPDAPVPIASMYNSARFNSPNDLTLRSDGNIYFTDPTWQAPSQPPQTDTRVYRVDPGGQVSSIDESLDQPNGITLSLDENTLYVADRLNIYRYDVDDAGAVTGKAPFVSGGSDGMGIDCVGNLYVTRAKTVLLFDPSGAPAGTLNVGSVGDVTNVAFGGPERRTLYITTLGDTQELWRAELAVPGMPY